MKEKMEQTADQALCRLYIAELIFWLIVGILCSIFR